MRFLRVFIGALLLLILVVFAVANKDAVTVSVEPLPFVIELPLYLLVFAVFFVGLALGVIIGRLNAWSASRRKAEAEKARRAAGPADDCAGRRQQRAVAPAAIAHRLITGHYSRERPGHAFDRCCRRPRSLALRPADPASARCVPHRRRGAAAQPLSHRCC